MKTTTFFALSAALFGLAAAAPVHKRDIIVQTVTSEVVTTVEITTTIWVDPPTATPSPDVEPAEFFESPAPTPEEEAPAPSSSSEAAPPAPSTTQAPAAPTPEAPAPPATTQAPPPVVESPPPQEEAETPAPQPETPAPQPETPAPQPEAPAPQPQTPAPQPEAPSTGGGSGQYSGDMTHYTPGLGACGVTNTDNDLIVAVSYKLFDPKTPNNNPNKNPLCNQKINIFYEGNTMEATITDRCAGCEIEGSLDMTQAMFNKITNGKGDGRVTTGMSWSFA